jgi:hypothetical protein
MNTQCTQTALCQNVKHGLIRCEHLFASVNPTYFLILLWNKSDFCTTAMASVGGALHLFIPTVAEALSIARETAPSPATIYSSGSGPLDCLLHFANAAPSWTSARDSRQPRCLEKTATLQWSPWTSISTFWRGTCHFIWKTKWKLVYSDLESDCRWCLALAQRIHVTTWCPWLR